MATEKRLIYTNALERRLVEMASAPNYKLIGEDWKNGLCMAMVAVNEMPSVDAVEVVRCKDCKKYHTLEEGYKDCIHPFGLDFPVPDDFCSYGEMKDNG